MRCSTPALALAVCGAVLTATVPTAQAACYEVTGCTDRDVFPERFLAREASCDILWQIRNQIYAENGYCFSTSRGIAAFGNANCRYRDANLVPLNQVERTNIATVQRVERMRACPR